MMSGVFNWGVGVALISLLMLQAFSADAYKADCLVENGVARGVIATSESPSKADLFAAEEVQIYLKKITGADVPIIKGDIPVGKPAVVIGGHPEAAAVHSSLAAFSTDQEAFALVTRGNRLYIVGNGDFAVCCGAWQWLESLGVRWIFPTEKGEYVPSRDTVPISRLNVFSAPAMSNRASSYTMNPAWGQPVEACAPEHGVDASALFSARMRINRNLGLFLSDAFITIGSGHSYGHYLPAGKHFSDHPEWFNMIGGKRVSAPGQVQVCFTNKDAAKEFANNLLIDIRKYVANGVKPDRLQVCVSPNDWKTWCECPECRKLVEVDPLGNMESATGMVVNFANMVAEEVLKEFPTAKIVFYAYDNYSKPSTKVLPGPGVYPEVVFWCWGGSVEANHCYPMFSDKNKRYQEYFNQWAKMCDGVSSYEYYGHYFWFTPWPKITQMSTDVKAMARNPKFYGMYSESHTHWGTQGPNLYLHPKLMWNPNLDVAAVMDDYYKAGFGPAAPYIKEYFDVLQKKMDSVTRIGGNMVELTRLLTPDIIRQCNRLIDQAEAEMPAMDENTRWRTDLIIQGWRYSAKMGEALQLYTSFADDRRGARAVILRNLRQIARFIETDQGRWTFEYRIVKSQLDSFLNALQMDLNNLNPGEHKYNESLMFGGALKFFGDVEGLTLDTYSFWLASKTPATIDIPFAAAAGHKITSLSINIGWYIDDIKDPGLLKAKVSVVKLDNTEVEVAPNLRVATGEISIPASLLDQQVRVRIECENTSTINCPIMTSFGANITVQ